MNAIEQRLVDGMKARGITGEASEEILRGITSFALYGFPESHAASFALIAYASAYLKRHHPAAFLAGLLNAQPMGFYSPATLVKDAQRHGVEVLPRIDVARSSGNAAHVEAERTREPPMRARLRLGLRYVAGLRAEPGRARRRGAPARALPRRRGPVRARGAAPRRARHARRARRARRRSIRGARRRAALWQVAALERDPRSLFAGVAPRRRLAAAGDDARRARRSPTTGRAASPPART